MAAKPPLDDDRGLAPPNMTTRQRYSHDKYKRTVPQIPVILFGEFIAAFGVIRALGPKQIPIYLVSQKATRNLCRYSRYVKASLAIEPTAPDYLDRLVSWGMRVVGPEAVLIVAGADEPLDVLSRLLPQLPIGWRPTIPGEEIVRRVRNKATTYAIAEEVSVPVPKTFAIKNRQELDALLASGNVPLPALMKSEKSAEFLKKYGTKGVIANNQDEINSFYDSYDGFLGELLLQEMIEGGEETLFCLKAVLTADHKIKTCFGDKKLRSGRQFSSCTLTVNAWDDIVFEQSRKLLERIEYIGYASIEYKKDYKTGAFKLMEINGRVSMNNSHALCVDINLPYAMYLAALDKDDEFIMPVKGAAQSKERVLWWLPTGEISLVLNSIRKNRRFPPRYFADLRGSRLIVEPFSYKDPLPGCYTLIAMISGIAKAAFGVLRKRIRLPSRSAKQP